MSDNIQDYEFEIEFDEVGLTKDNREVGMFSGAAHIDQDGYVVGLVLDTYKPDEIGKPKRGTLYLPVPPASYSLYRSRLDPFWLAIADNLATRIEREFTIEIQERLNEWREARSEPDPDYEYDRRRDEPDFFSEAPSNVSE